MRSTLVREAARVLGLPFGMEVTRESFVASLVFPAEPDRPGPSPLGAMPHA